MLCACAIPGLMDTEELGEVCIANCATGGEGEVSFMSEELEVKDRE